MHKRNFLITYNSRVGSTALIDTLKLIPPIVIPIFEDLDSWFVEANTQLDTINEATVHRYVDELYRTDRNGRPAREFTVGFKWRPWGDVSALAEVLHAHDVLVFNLTRADIVEFVASLYLSDVVYRDFNAPQFTLRDTVDAAERERLLFRYRMTHVVVDLDSYFALARERIAAERTRVAFLTQLRHHGVSIRTILYEDFAYKRFHFLEGLMAALNLPRLKRLPVVALAKVTTALPTELFRNRDALFAEPALHQLLVEWEDLVYRSDMPELQLGYPASGQSLA